MAAIFQDVTLMWDGNHYVIPANRVLGAIAVIEEHFTFPELFASLQGGKPSVVTLAKAWGGIMRYAGVAVTDDEAYAGIFADGGTVSERVTASVTNLLMLMMPPASLMALAAQATAPGNQETAPGKPKAASKPSKRSTKRRSASAAG